MPAYYRRRGHYKSRCKICQLDSKRRVEVENKITKRFSLRKIAKGLKKSGVEISYGSIFRHKKYMLERGNIKESPDKFYERYIEERSEKLTTTSLLLEKDVLLKLQQRQKGSLSATINWLLRNWLRKRYEGAIRELTNNIFQHRKECGWKFDRRRRLKEGVRKSITLDKDNKEKLVLLKDEISDLEYIKESDGEWLKFKDDPLKADTLVFPNAALTRWGQTSQSELINGILRLSLNI